MRFRRTLAASGAAAMLLFAAPAAEARSGADEVARSPRACEDESEFWPLWRALAATGDPQTADLPLFPLAEVLAALRAVPLSEPLPARGRESLEYYRSPVPYQAEGQVWQQTIAYAEAAASYEAGDYAAAIGKFDAIAATAPPATFPRPLYRAASAYSAARASFDLGNFADGAIRIDRILADPSLGEFWTQSWSLIAYMRYQTDAPPLAAAELVQISRLLVTPTAILCPEPSSAAAFPDADFGLKILKLARADFDLSDPRRLGTAREFQRPGVEWAARDPVIDALSRMPSYPNFEASGLEPGWSDAYLAILRPRSPSWPATDPNSDRAAVGRDRWRETGNPLWALVLGEYAAARDLPALADAIARSRAWPDLSDRARATLVWALAAYRARLLLRLGKDEDAMAALEVPTPKERAALGRDLPELVQGAFESLVNGGTRYLLAQHRWAAARRWAILASKALDWPIAEPLKPLLAADPTELYRHPVLQLTPVDGEIRLGPWRRLFDGWSSARLIEFSRRDEIASADRRALVGAAWIRAFALGHWDDVFAWLPDLGRAFPSLEPDIALIDRSWLPGAARHLALRLALRAPGLVAVPSWSRPPDNAPRYETLGEIVRPADVTKLDPYDPSDGNWWCSPEAEAILEDDRNAILGELEPEIEAAETEPRSTPAGIDAWRDRKAAMLAKFAEEIPLLRIGDGAELAALARSGSSARRFAEDALAWGRDKFWFEDWFVSEDLLAETLHLAVRATRIGCRRPPDNSTWSRAAFVMLHRRYPNSSWAKQTPYWYGAIP